MHEQSYRLGSKASVNNYSKYSDYYKEYSKKYYKENKEKRLLKIKEWQENNSDKVKKYTLQYYYKNRQEISKRKNKYVSII